MIVRKVELTLPATTKEMEAFISEVNTMSDCDSDQAVDLIPSERAYARRLSAVKEVEP